MAEHGKDSDNQPLKGGPDIRASASGGDAGNQGRIRAGASSDNRIHPEMFEPSSEKKHTRQVLFWRPPVHPDGGPPDLPDGMSLLVTWPPDLSAQMQLLAGALCPSPETLARLNATVASIFSAAFPNAVVLSRCDGTGLLSIGLWAVPAPREEAVAARMRALAALALLGQDETFGFFVNTSFIHRLAQSEFARMPKRLDARGRPDSSGPIHLQRLSVRLAPPNRVVTRVEGFDDRPWPDIEFAVEITDTLGVSASPLSVSCGSGAASLRPLTCASSRNVDVDDSDIALAITLGILALPLPPLGALLFDQLIEASGGGGTGGGGTGGAVGCGLTAFANTPIPLPGRSSVTNTGSSIAVSYTRSAVTPGGIFFRGGWTLCTRAPMLFIDGPSLLEAYVDDTEVSATYRAVTVDTSGAVAPSWSAPDANISAPSAQMTRIVFSLRAGSLSRTVTLAGADADGPLPPATLTVQIRLTDRPPTPGHRRRPGRQPEPL